MANNRLWAVCKDDNEACALSKYYPGKGSGWGGPWFDQQDFFDRHDDCISNNGCGENIVFVTELDDRVKRYDFTKRGETKIYFK